MKPLRPKDKRWLNRVRRMRLKGLTWDEIADKVGLNRNTAVSRHDRLEHRELAEAANETARAMLVPEEV